MTDIRSLKHFEFCVCPLFSIFLTSRQIVTKCGRHVMQFQEQHIRIFLLRAISNTNTPDQLTCYTALPPLALEPQHRY
jgi:hypothetical protein